MKELRKYKILTFIRYLGDAFFYPFLSLYLNSTGLKETKIGVLLALTPIISIIINPLYAAICKNVKITRNVLKVVTVVEAICIVLVANTTNYWLLLILIIVIGIFGTSHYSLMDSVISVYANEENIAYSSIRIYGSIAYIIATIIAGFAITGNDYRLSFYICSLLFIIAGFLYQRLIPINTESEKEGRQRNIKAVLTNKCFWAFLLYYCITHTPLVVVKNFFSLFIQEKGIGSSQYGLIYAMIVLSETITILILGKFKKKLKDIPTLIFANLIIVLMLLINALDVPLWLIIIAANARGICWGIMLHISCRRIIQLVGTENDTFALMLLGLFSSAFTAIASAISGNIIEQYSYQTFHLIMMGITLMGSIILLASAILNPSVEEKIEYDKIA